MKTSRLLTVGHSYIVSLNRRLAHELTRTAPQGWEVTLCSPRLLSGDLRPLQLELDAGEPCQIIPVDVRWSSKIHLMAYDRKLKELLSQSWDLVHAWEEPYIYSGSQISRWTNGQPLIYYTYQNISKKYPPPFGWFERSSLSKAAGWIAGGETSRDALIDRQGYSAKPHCIIPLGVDVLHFRPDRCSGSAVRRLYNWDADEPPVVGYLGRFVPEKGLRILMKALDQCTAPWRALFVGNGPLLKEIEQWATAYPGRVAIVPGVKHDQVPAYLNAMDILAAPSQTTRHWREQLGRMITEAFACGIPVIASNSGEIPNVVQSAGVTLDEADIGAWAKTIDTLIENPERRRMMSEAGLERAHSEFAWSVIAKKHWKFFLRVLGRD